MYYYKAIKNIDIVFCIKKNINNNDFYFLLAPVTKQIKKSNIYFQIKVLIYPVDVDCIQIWILGSTIGINGFEFGSLDLPFHNSGSAFGSLHTHLEKVDLDSCPKLIQIVIRITIFHKERGCSTSALF